MNLYNDLPLMVATIGVLLIFALLVLFGITESSIVALILFSIHILTLSILWICCVIHLAKDPSVLIANWNTDLEISVANAIFAGFGAGMLGITGFETSANYIGNIDFTPSFYILSF